MARIDLGVEPAHMPDFFSIFMNDSMDTANMKGMLQVNTSPPQRLTRWRTLRPSVSGQARKNADRMGFEANSVGLMEFGHGVNQQSITCTAHITQAAMDLVRESLPWVRTSAITGRSTEAPFNIEMCMQCCAPSLDFSCPWILKAKMLREDIFRPLMVGPAGNAG
ncbi:hypothetical protein B0H13DRAFT_2342078 [Mycena leptocephala]|nr:hypothetical protein B0H13DRAFT_2342078 [Mycena leptocephala]